jgi:hypothetical protein
MKIVHVRPQEVGRHGMLIPEEVTSMRQRQASPKLECLFENQLILFHTEAGINPAKPDRK